MDRALNMSAALISKFPEQRPYIAEHYFRHKPNHRHRANRQHGSGDSRWPQRRRVASTRHAPSPSAKSLIRAVFERFRGFLLFLSTAVDDRIRMSPTVIHVARRR